jgi:hypothetical protein
MKDSKEKIDQEKIDQLKTRYPEGIFEGEITFDDEDGKPHSVEFIFRKPLIADVESHTKSSQKNPIVANLNLIQSLIVHPEPGPIVEEIRAYPMAYAKFMDDVLTPFIGANSKARSRKL